MKIKEYVEKNKTLKILKILFIFVFLFISIFSFIYGESKINTKVDNYQYEQSLELQRDYDYEDYDEDCTVCEVRYILGDDELFVNYSYEDYLNLEEDSITGYKYKVNEEYFVILDNNNASINEIQKALKDRLVVKYNLSYVLSISSIILSICVSIIFVFSNLFSNYEKIWFISIMGLSSIVSILFPESSINGLNGIIIMLLYMLDTFFNILCELLISKQSRWNFIVSVLVEITEIVTCILLMYRFATLAVTLLFWLPIDIISFVNWSKHKDSVIEELTIVRKLKGYQEVLVILGIVIWTIVVGYFLSGLEINTELFKNDTIESVVIYMDACASAVGIANGVFILLRYKEQWIAWYICSILELVINILAGQYILIVLKIGYLTNTTYGYIKWSKYINNHQKLENSLL